jgi:hypothetical protein
VTRIGELGTTLAVTNNRRALRTSVACEPCTNRLVYLDYVSDCQLFSKPCLTR